ncbi:hypothetical protein F511_14358 [Dorcoceras hygrometricum]|uniref:UspA domain-containing protein n=1 Tax=Dorcoceras hygrometricum TaxID=472368 RepID=A0A2Z7AAP7_9LAMI|nr:hypothetical protein F511_14358 [Dorcoceras hygrometricum]
MSGWCMSRVCVRVRSHVRVRSPSQHYGKTAGFSRGEKPELSNQIDKLGLASGLTESECGNRVMVVVDSSLEARGALDWVLSHTVRSQDKIILLHVVKQDAANDGETNQRAYDLLRSSKSMCQLKRPEVQVEMAIREGKEKGPIIVEEAKRLRASLLVLGQQKQSLLWRLRLIWKRKRSRVVDYCIQYANCMTIAVRRKNRKYGGYLITTKRHKNFWLLA